MFKKQGTNVDTILSNLNRNIDDLYTLALNKTSEAQKTDEEIQLLECKAVAAREEAKRAETVAHKIKTLISE